MTDLARFMNRREQTIWHISGDQHGVLVDAANAASLQQLSWLFPVAQYDKPHILGGNARVEQRDDNWAVIAGDGKQLRISTPLIKEAPH